MLNQVHQIEHTVTIDNILKMLQRVQVQFLLHHRRVLAYIRSVLITFVLMGTYILGLVW